MQATEGDRTMTITTCIFDAYGTLFDVAAAAREAAAEPGRERFAEHWPKVAGDWRLKQLQYTWLRGHHRRALRFLERDAGRSGLGA